MDKKAIALLLDEMGTLLELQGANPFKARAFHNASRAIEGVTGDVAAMAASGEILSVKGIGASIGEIIGELVRTGASKEHAALRAKVPAGVLDMLRIPGLGPKRVRQLYTKKKIAGLEDLERAARSGTIAKLEGFGEKTAENILKGIELLRTAGERALFPAADEAARALLADLRKVPGIVRSEIAGSLRRRRETIGDIDFLVSAPDRRRPAIMKAFVSHPRVQRIVARGETKSSVQLDAGINCDLRIVTDAEFPFALNYFTGSKEHNVEMRSRARQRGWSLNEYAFTRIADPPPKRTVKAPPRCATEEEIYAALGLEYVVPELREAAGEFEAAEAGTLPVLVTDGDIRGTLHCHSTWSDGVNTIAEMAAAARALGWEYLGIADHSKSAAYAGGLTEARVRAQWKEIDALNGHLRGFRVLKGTECDILPDGRLDWPATLLDGFDYVVASVHSSFKMSEEEMTRRIVKAVSHPRVTMLGHPTGRLLLSREPYPVDMIRVIDAAAAHGTMIEINAHPMRLDLDWRLCRYARDKGVMIAINPDAHGVDGLRDVFVGLGVARKGWLRAADILNTRPAADVVALLTRSRERKMQ
jgi:DNA polymerase (family 10)